MEISGQIFGHIMSFLSNRWLWVVLGEKFPQEYPVNPGLRQGSSILHFTYYTLMTFLMMLSTILLFMLMILLSTISVVRHLIWGNSHNWLLKLNLIFETLLSWFLLTSLLTLVLLLWKRMGMFLRDYHLLRCWGCLLNLNWIGALTLSLLLKMLPRKLLLYIYKFPIRPCMEYCCHVLTAAHSCYLELLDKLNKIVRQRQIYKTFNHLLAASLELLAYRHNVASFSCFHRYYFISFPYSRMRSTCYFQRLHSVSVTILRSYKHVCLYQ